MKKLLVLIWILSFSVFAGEFDQVGVVDTFRWAPPTYTTGFEYDVFYYIPQGFKKTDKRSMIFMHGGGSSTMSREGSARVAKMYINDLKTLADQMKFIIVAPSGSGLNWGGHTRVMIRELAKFMRTKLNLSAKRMVLAGHSMGGMGITRNAHWLIDQFAAFIPMAAGMDPKHATEGNLQTYFNTYYHHLQGLNDHFRVFIERCENQKAEIEKLEQKFRSKSGFVMEFYEGSHNYQKPLIVKTLKNVWKNHQRNLLRPVLRGHFYHRNTVNEYNNIKYNLTSTKSYLWLEANEFKPLGKDQIAKRDIFTASIIDNKIDVQFTEAHGVKTLRVYLSEQMLNFADPIEVWVDGELEFRGHIQKKVDMSVTRLLKADNDFNFESYIDIAL
jgi:hypothetical protein